MSVDWSSLRKNIIIAQIFNCDCIKTKNCFFIYFKGIIIYLNNL